MSTTEQKQETALAPRPANGAPVNAPQPVPTPQYLGGFDGMATAPFPDAARAVLAEQVDPDAVEIKPDGIVFAPGVWYRRQLTRAFGPGGWGLAMRGPVRTMPQNNGGDLVVYHGALICLGRFVAEAHGQCVYWPKNGGMTYADAVEGARTDCITRCCKDLGMATELWDAGWRGRWMTEHALKAWVEGSGQSKAKWFFWRRDREAPYQVTKANARPQPAADAPDAAPPRAETTRPKDGPAATTSASPAASATTAGARRAAGAGARTSAAVGASSEPQPMANPPKDDGEAPEEEDMATLDELVFKSLKWKPDFAGKWLNARFGTRAPSSLTKLQLKTAFVLLYAFARGKDAYEAELAKQKAEGMVRG